MLARVALVSLVGLLGATASACRDNARFSSRGDRFEGTVAQGSFVRSGIAENVQMCLTLDTDRLQDTPGTISTSDGRLKAVPMRPIPQVWHDPLSTLTFGDGRLQNLLYVAAADDGADVMIFVSLMQSDAIEVRVVRSAPGGEAQAPPPLFGVFTLEKQEGACSF